MIILNCTFHLFSLKAYFILDVCFDAVDIFTKQLDFPQLFALL